MSLRDCLFFNLFIERHGLSLFCGAAWPAPAVLLLCNLAIGSEQRVALRRPLLTGAMPWWSLSGMSQGCVTTQWTAVPDHAVACRNGSTVGRAAPLMPFEVSVLAVNNQLRW